MALVKYIIDARIKVSGLRSILGLDNPIDLNQHIKNVVADSTTSLTFEGAQTFNQTIEATEGVTSGTFIAGFYPVGATNNITAGTGGAISVTNYFTTINTDAGGDAFTLADGTQIGQLKLVRLVADGGGDAVITPANLSGGTTVTFGDAGDEAEFIWDGTEWILIKNLGVALA